MTRRKIISKVIFQYLKILNCANQIKKKRKKAEGLLIKHERSKKRIWTAFDENEN